MKQKLQNSGKKYTNSQFCLEILTSITLSIIERTTKQTKEDIEDQNGTISHFDVIDEPLYPAILPGVFPKKSVLFIPAGISCSRFNTVAILGLRLPLIFQFVI